VRTGKLVLGLRMRLRQLAGVIDTRCL